MEQNFPKPSDLLNYYNYGSRVYGTASESSDYDYILVIKDNSSFKKEYLKVNNYEYHFVKKSEFEQKLNDHKIDFLECYFAPKEMVFFEHFRPKFEIDKWKLRKSISQVCNNSWSKCRKKIEQGDYYIGIKSLFHSIRILHFGIQIAKYGKIIDYSECNNYWKEINDGEFYDWEYFKNKYKPLMNKKQSEFRALCPKPLEIN